MVLDTTQRSFSASTPAFRAITCSGNHYGLFTAPRKYGLVAVGCKVGAMHEYGHHCSSRGSMPATLCNCSADNAGAQPTHINLQDHDCDQGLATSAVLYAVTGLPQRLLHIHLLCGRVC